MIGAFVPTATGSIRRGLVRTPEVMRQSAFTGRWTTTGRRVTVNVNKVSEVREAKECVRTPMQMVSVRAGIALYGILIAGSGFSAFMNTRSRPSIISGLVSGLVLANAYYKNNVQLAFITACVLGVVFALRYIKSKKFMPAGLLCVLSIVAAIFFSTSWRVSI